MFPFEARWVANYNRVDLVWEPYGSCLAWGKVQDIHRTFFEQHCADTGFDSAKLCLRNTGGRQATSHQDQK